MRNTELLVVGTVSKCKFCGADILWVKSKSTQKWYPINPKWHYPGDPDNVQAGNKTHYHKCQNKVVN
jgi:hypothetical protein